MTISEEDKILQNLMNTILIVAMDDGKITEDELAILKQVKLDVQSLREKIEHSAETSLHKDSELELLNLFKKDLLKNAYSISQKDKKITVEERNLINTLISILMK